MDILTLIDKINKNNKNSNINKNSSSKSKSKIRIKENNKEKNNITENNYDLAINYYTKKIKNNNEDVNHLIKRAICYLAKGYYSLALKDALNTIEINNNYSKGYYIASLCYLEMYDIDSAEKYLMNKNKRLKNLIDKNKKDIIIKSKKYKTYPLYIKFLKELYKYNSFFPKLKIHFYTDDYRGVLAKTDIYKNEIIMTIPKCCLITLENALRTEYGKKIGKFMYNELNSPKHCLLSSFLLYEEQNQKYKYYFDLLPKKFDNFPIFYNKEELGYLKGSPFLNQILEKKKEMKNDYYKICEYIPDFKRFKYNKFKEFLV